MKKNSVPISILLLILSVSSCEESQEGVVQFALNPDSMAQVIDGFGASDCWSMQFVGKWPSAKREAIADLLFSQEIQSDGSPKGIGLSIWRFNMGAGSAYQKGETSKIGSPWTRTESFLQPNGTYDWTAQEGQRRFMQMAKERGVEQFTLFLNSPNVRFTQNGLATNTGRGDTYNLKIDSLKSFISDIVDVTEHLRNQEGIPITHISPLNEPDGHWNWQGPKQEGTPAKKQEIAQIVRSLGQELANRQVDVDIIMPESSDYRCMYDTHMTDATRGYLIQSFYTPDSADTYIADTPNFSGIIAGHAYWTTTTPEELKESRLKLREALDNHGAKFWQTEYCIMGNDEEIGGGHGFDFTMKTALYVARIMHYDLTLANASTWQWWRAAGEDYKDGLIRIYPNEAMNDGEFKDSKLMWAIGNYSRFVRPGAIRLNADYTDPEGLMLSAYRNHDGKMVIVAINYSDEEQAFRVPGDKHKWRAYQTSDEDGDNMRYMGDMKLGKKTLLSPRSIVTYVED